MNAAGGGSDPAPVMMRSRDGGRGFLWAPSRLTECVQIGRALGHHLAELRRAGLVMKWKYGRWVSYRLTSATSVRRLVREVLRLLADDPRLSENARIVAALRAIPVMTLCRARLDLSAIGITTAGRRTRGNREKE